MDLLYNFELNIYRYLYSDLSNLSDDELVEHYIKYGRFENRITNLNDYLLINPNDKNIYNISNDNNIINNILNKFQLQVYKKLNVDIPYIYDEDFLIHYIKHGRHENRICNIDDYLYVNPSDYKKIYEDIRYLSDEDAIIHYIKYGRHENRIYNLNKNNSLIIIAAHTDNYIKYKILLNNIKYFYNKNYDIILINSIEFKDKYNFDIFNNIRIIFIDNDNYLDFGKWIYVLKNMNYKQYNNIIFTNDSYILTNNIDNYLSDVIKNNIDYFGFTDNYEIGYHYQSYLFSLNSKSINTLIDNFDKLKYNIKNYDDVVFNCEVNMLSLYKNNRCFFYNLNPLKNNIFFRNDNLYEQLLLKDILPIIKLKRITDNNVDFPPPFLINKIKELNIFKDTDIDLIDNYINKYKILFHKYYLNISKADDNINYIVYNENKININIKYFCHIHCFNLNDLYLFFNVFIDNYKNYFNIIITYSFGEIPPIYLDILFLKIDNKGADIGAKICAIKFLYDRDINFEYILFIHSKKSDVEDRENYIRCFNGRAELIINILKDNSKKIDAIFPNYHNFYYTDKINYHTINGNQDYIDEFYSFLNIENKNNFNWFNGTNTLLLSKKIINFIFSPRKIKMIYNALNSGNSFDYNWVKIKYNLVDSIENVYNKFLLNNYIGNVWNDPIRNMPNACIEHVFERIWVNIVKHLNLNYICLPNNNIFDFFNIKINCIYFPQFHNSKENNEFWGEGFTEWTILKPYKDEFYIRDNLIQIMKPHEDIGYYSLDYIETFKKQIDLAKKYNINGFVFYHYWFNNNRSVLNKLEEYLLRDDINIPFCFSWANEPWTRQWDGTHEGILIRQEYEESNNFEHINYLINFFKKSNYIRNNKGKCLFYIYNYIHIQPFIKKIKEKWKSVLQKHNLKIKIIFTKNANPKNKISDSKIKYEFLPLCQIDAWTFHHYDNLTINNEIINKIPIHYEIDYNNLIEKYNSNEIKDNYHFGLPLNWNNIVRKNNMAHLHITNFNKENLKRMLLLIISKIILKYQNKYLCINVEKYNTIAFNNDENKYDLDNNNIIINAWNEWNEQAILEPNNITGYENLETINDIITSL